MQKFQLFPTFIKSILNRNKKMYELKKKAQHRNKQIYDPPSIYIKKNLFEYLTYFLFLANRNNEYSCSCIHLYDSSDKVFSYKQSRRFIN